MDCELTQTSTVSNTEEINCESDGKLVENRPAVSWNVLQEHHFMVMDIISNKSQ